MLIEKLAIHPDYVDPKFSAGEREHVDMVAAAHHAWSFKVPQIGFRFPLPHTKSALANVDHPRWIDLIISYGDGPLDAVPIGLAREGQIVLLE